MHAIPRVPHTCCALHLLLLQATASATQRGPMATSWLRLTSRQVGLPWGVVQTHAAVAATHSVLDHHLYITTRSMQAGWKGVSCCAPAPSPRGRQSKQTRTDCRRVSMCLTCRHATCQAWAPPWVSLPGVLVALLPPPWARLACLAMAASSCALLAWITCTHARQPASLPAAQEARSLAGCRTCMTANNTDGVAPLLMHLTQLTLATLWRTPQCTHKSHNAHCRVLAVCSPTRTRRATRFTMARMIRQTCGALRAGAPLRSQKSTAPASWCAQLCDLCSVQCAGPGCPCIAICGGMWTATWYCRLVLPPVPAIGAWLSGTLVVSGLLVRAGSHPRCAAPYVCSAAAGWLYGAVL